MFTNEQYGNAVIVKVLIISKDLESMGGVANYLRVFLKHYYDEHVAFETLYFGSRSDEYYKKPYLRIRYVKQYLRDFYGFIKIISGDKRIRIVQVNPSLIPVPLIRDGLLILVSKLFGRKVVVLFHGWDVSFSNVLKKRIFLRMCMIWVYRKSDRILVLAERFKMSLIRWGIDKEKISVTRTMFDGDLVLPYQNDRGNRMRFLFLSRISELKGIFEIVKAAAWLSDEGYDFQLKFVGFGKDIDSVQKLQHYAEENAVADKFTFQGFLDGKKKYEEYAKADIFLLPSYSEGCPTSVLEAMASGLFVISTNVGAMKEVVRDKVNGRIVKVKDSHDLFKKMKWVLDNINTARELGKQNVPYAFSNFESRIITNQIRTIYNTLI